MDLVVEELSGDLVVRVEETRIDAAGAVLFKDEMRAQLAGPHPRVILDLSKVDFIDSSGLGAVVAILKEAGNDTGFALAGLSGNVLKVFRLTRMDQVFNIFPDVVSAFDDVKHAS